LAALKVDPGFLLAIANLVTILSHENELLVALSFVRKVLNVDPMNGGQWNNLGNLLTRLERFDEALKALDRAAELVPDDRTVWHNLALTNHRIGNNDEAVKYVQRVKDMGGESPVLENDYAHMLLAKGDLEQALPAYETRWYHLQHLPPWDFHVKEWTGEDLKGKSLLLHAEQGYGDTIMTSRFAVDLKRLGAKEVILGVPQAMADLFTAQSWCDGVLCMENMNEDNVGKFDYQSPMYSAMRWLGIRRCSIRSWPYLQAPEIVVPRVSAGQFNVGICWASGKRGTEMDWRRRVTPLSLWFQLAEVPRVQLWSLYKEPQSEDPHKEISQALIQDVMPKLNSWAETAAFINQLDLVVTIDTAVGHLAAAMGKPTIMLAQYQHCWRWWNIDQGTGKPWYEHMTIIRQKVPGDWDGQLKAVRFLLGNMVREQNVDLAA
jgi:hypothetical protein